MLRPVHSDERTVVEFRTDVRVALAVNFVSGKKLNVRPQFAPVDRILSIFDLDVDLAGLDLSPFRFGPAETLVQVGMKRGVLQLPGHFETELVRLGAIIDSEKFA